MVAQFRFADPLDGGTTKRTWFAVFDLAEEKFQVDGFLRVIMRDALEQFSYPNTNAEFFHQLARETLLEGFARLAFAPGEFPKPAQVRVSVALCDEEFARAENQTGGDINDK